MEPVLSCVDEAGKVRGGAKRALSLPACLPRGTRSWEVGLGPRGPCLARGGPEVWRRSSRRRATHAPPACLPACPQAAGFGPLKGGFLAAVTSATCRALLAQRPCALLAALGVALQFEMAVGLNGRVWLDSSAPRTTITLAKLLAEVQAIFAPVKNLGHLEGLKENN